MRKSPHVYDKAKYHMESVEGHGLPEEHAYHHTTFFLSWLLKHHMMSDFFERESETLGEDFRAGRATVNAVYEFWDCCLISDMLSEEGNAFAMAYYDFDRGAYLPDYLSHLQGSLPSEFHVPYTPENERRIHAIIDQRYQEWNRGKKWWQFWK